MEEQNQNLNNSNVKKQIVPGAFSAMFWGISSILAMYMFGWVASIVGFSKRSAALKLYEVNPNVYSDKSLNILRTAKTCSMIGLFVSIFSTLLLVLYIVFMVWMATRSYYSPYY